MLSHMTDVEVCQWRVVKEEPISGSVMVACARGDDHMSIVTFIFMTHRRVDVEMYSFYAVLLALL